MKIAPSPFNKQKIWEEYLKIEGFTVCLWSSQRLCYGAVYYAYENFLRHCVSVGKKKQNYRPKPKVFMSDFMELFGAEICNICLGDKKIEQARLVRNSLVHNGGRISSEIMKKILAKFQS